MRTWGCVLSGTQRGRDAHEVPFSPASAPGPSPGSGRFQDADSALAPRRRRLDRAPEAPNAGLTPFSPGAPGSRYRLRNPEVLRCPPAGGGARPGEAGPERPGRPQADQALPDLCNRWGREAANGRVPLPVPTSRPLLLPRSIASLLVVLLLEDYGSAGQQVGAAAALRVQRQLRGIAAGLQRARLPAAVRAAPAGAQDAAGPTGHELQVAAGVSPRRGRPLGFNHQTPDSAHLSATRLSWWEGGSIILRPKLTLVSELIFGRVCSGSPVSLFFLGDTGSAGSTPWGPAARLPSREGQAEESGKERGSIKKR